MSQEQPAQVSTDIPQKGVDELEKLELKNAWLEMQNIKLQIQLLQNDLLTAQQAMKTSVEKMQQLRDRIANKYKVDLNTTTLDDAGNFVPARPLSGLPRL